MSEGKMSAEDFERMRLWLECEWDASVDGVKEAMAAQEAVGHLIEYALTLQREADGMREALSGISQHAENQDISHLNFRILAKQCADEALEACSPQDRSSEEK